jgi:NAD(P)-dependent dehydrogenase (short-subunit alcohol dehydrogenase family)
MPQVWFVTGSTRGLGRALVEAALQAGNQVAATARNPEGLRDLVDAYGDAIRALPQSKLHARLSAGSTWS